MIDELIKNLKDGEGSFEYEGNIITYKISKNGYEIKVESKNKRDSSAIELVEQFKSDIDQLDDSIFELASEMYTGISHKSLTNFSNLLSTCPSYSEVKTEILNFRKAISDAIDKEIARLLELKKYGC